MTILQCAENSEEVEIISTTATNQPA